MGLPIDLLLRNRSQQAFYSGSVLENLSRSFFQDTFNHYYFPYVELAHRLCKFDILPTLGTDCLSLDLWFPCYTLSTYMSLSKLTFLLVVYVTFVLYPN